MYRPEWFPKEDILTVALNVHMYVAGSYDTMLEDHKLNVKTLQYALANWEEYNSKPKEFDNAVKKIIEIAIKESKSIPWMK